MRGNETKLTELVGELQEKFPIPMRGNDSEDRRQAALEARGFRSP